MNDKLINKDIEKVSVIVDTDDLSQTDGTRSNFDYKIKFNENGFGGVFNNVIGFRLKKAFLRNNPILIDSSNSTIVLTSGGSGDATYTLNAANYGFYSGSSWATVLKTASNWTGNAPFSTCTFDTNTNKLTFQASTFDFGTHKESARLLGFNPSTTTGSESVSDFPIDLSNHYLDVVVSEIPSIACK